MQLSGGQYSRSTVGLRQPQQILDQQFKLVFIYPMICDRKLTKYQDLVRAFISTSMLKEIYVSNALNIVGMASNVTPLIDEHGNLVDTGSVGSAGAGAGAGEVQRARQDAQQAARFDIERRVQEKTQHITKLLDIDPQLRKFKPYVQMITLNNFIDVPVIVGTKAFQVEPHVLMFVFAVAVSSRGQLSLTSHTDIQRIFRIIHQMGSNDINIILNNLIDLPRKDVFDTVSEWLTNHPRIERVLRHRGISWLNTPVSWVRTGVRRLTHDRRQRHQEDTVQYPGVDPDLAGQILQITQNAAQEAEVYFRLCLDPDSMAAQFGYRPERGQLKETFDRINPRINEVFTRGEMHLTNVLWPNNIVPIITSFLYTIVPTGSGISISGITTDLQNGSQNISGMIGPIIEYLKGDFKTQLNATLEQHGPEKADEMLDGIKNICQTYFDQSINIYGRRTSNLQDFRLRGTDYTIPDHMEYEKAFDQAISEISAFTGSLDGALREIFPNRVVDDLMTHRTEEVINNALNSVISYFRTYQGFPKDTAFIIQSQIADQADQNSEIMNYISETKKQIIFYVRFMVLKTILYILCQYVQETKVVVETTKHDVLDPNNYTIVTSVENILVLANAFAAKSYIDLVEKSRRGEKGQVQAKLMRDLSNRYIKGVVKYMHNQLGLPNLFVIDEQRGDVYYKLMYQSDVNKIKLNTMQTYIDSVLDR